jgi:hypothetical protein
MQKLAEEKEQDNFNSELVRQIVDATGQIQAKEEREKYEEALFYAEANKQLALDAKHRKQRQKEQEEAANRLHVENMRSSRWLCEDPSNGRRMDGGVRRDQWKGMSVQQLQSHYDAQFEQLLDKKNRKMLAAQEESEFAERQNMIQDAMQQVVLKEQNERYEMERTYRMQQAEQAARTTERKRSEVITGAVTEEFFKQFGSSHR